MIHINKSSVLLNGELTYSFCVCSSHLCCGSNWRILCSIRTLILKNYILLTTVAMIQRG